MIRIATPRTLSDSSCRVFRLGGSTIVIPGFSRPGGSTNPMLVAHATGRGCAGLPALTEMRNIRTSQRGISGIERETHRRNPSLTFRVVISRIKKDRILFRDCSLGRPVRTTLAESFASVLSGRWFEIRLKHFSLSKFSSDGADSEHCENGKGRWFRNRG